jgi:hypothetical protein
MRTRGGARNERRHAARGGALDELMNLLAQLGLGISALPIYDMIMDLDTESMSQPQLEHAIRSILTLHGCEPCSDAVIGALAEVGFAGLGTRAPERRHSRGGRQ